MNIVEQIARRIDAEGAYSKAFGSTAQDALPLAFTTRQKYFQAKYEHDAIEIVKLLAGLSRAALRSELIEWEKQGWKRLGIDMPAELVEGKYPPPSQPSETPHEGSGADTP